MPIARIARRMAQAATPSAATLPAQISASHSSRLRQEERRGGALVGSILHQ